MESDLGIYSNLKQYLTTRLGALTNHQQDYLHKTRLYVHETSASGFDARCQGHIDINRSKIIHLRGKLAGVTNDWYHIVPPGTSFDFKFTKADESYYLIRESLPDGDEEEYKVEILEAQLHLTRVRLSQEANDLFTKYWQKEGLYSMPYTKTEVILPSDGIYYLKVAGTPHCYQFWGAFACHQQCVPKTRAPSAYSIIPRHGNGIGRQFEGF